VVHARKLSIYVTRAVPEDALAFLRSQPDVGLVTVNPLERPLTPSELRAALAPHDGALVLLTDRIDAGVLEAAPRLRALGCVSVGTDNVDLEAARSHGVSVANTPDVLTDATADFAFALLLAASRRLVEADALVRAGKFPPWAPLFHLGLDLTGRTLGLVGAGRIGQAVERRARGFGLRVLYWARSTKPGLDAVGARRVELDELLRESDFVSLHVALTPETRHLIDARRLALMKPTAVLVNTARGAVVDEAALVAALRAGKLAAAGLDVFEDEPRLAPGLAELGNVVLAPHVASATHGTRSAMALLAARGCLAALRGEKPATWVPGSAWPPRAVS